MKNGKNSPINPLPSRISPNYGSIEHSHHGLTKREYFAVMAMQGIWSNSESITALLKVGALNELSTDLNGCEKIAALSTKAADALLAELEKTNEE